MANLKGGYNVLDLIEIANPDGTLKTITPQLREKLINFIKNGKPLLVVNSGINASKTVAEFTSKLIPGYLSVLLNNKQVDSAGNVYGFTGALIDNQAATINLSISYNIASDTLRPIVFNIR